MLSAFLELNVFHFLLVFARLGAALMLLPGFAGELVSARLRLMIALTTTFVILPVVAPALPPPPLSAWHLVLLFIGEVTIGVFFGVVVQGLMTALNLAGNFIGYQVGLTNAFVFDPVTEQQSALLTGFLANLAVVMIFITDTHHLMLHGIVDSYAVFIPGQVPAFGDMSQTLIQGLGASFVLGMKLAAPLFVFSILFFSTLGLLSRMLPQMQVFFIALPMQLFTGLGLLMITLPAIMLYFMTYLQGGISAFLGR
jgi:flagellar biosynthetic protein FliR